MESSSQKKNNHLLHLENQHVMEKLGQAKAFLSNIYFLCAVIFFFQPSIQNSAPLPAVWNDTVQEQFYPIVCGSAKADLKAAYNKQLKQYVSALNREKRKEKKSRSLLFVLWEREI